MNIYTSHNKVRALLEAATVIDGHCDILIPLTERKMVISDRVELPDPDTWVAPTSLQGHPYVKFGFNPHTIHFGCMGQYDIPRWKEGGINTQLCAIYLDDSKLDAPYEAGMAMVDTFHRNINSEEALRLCTTVSDIEKAKKDGKIGWVLTFEGCEALGGHIRNLKTYYERGLRVVSLTHTRSNIFSEGCLDDEAGAGLSELGRSLVQEISRLNIVLDLVHIGRKAFWDVIEIVDRPLIVSHSTSTMFASTAMDDQDVMNGKVSRPRLELPRDKDVLRAIADKNGVLGMIWLLYKDLDAAVDDIETALDIMGEDHIGLGSDLYGYQLATPELEDIAKLPNLIHALIKRGHAEETIVKFLGANYLRVFEAVWGE